ncbi:hypothetical protein D3C80_1468890 [compost metagenome]
MSLVDRLSLPVSGCPGRQKNTPRRGVSAWVWKLGSASKWRMSATKNSISSRSSERPSFSQLSTAKQVRTLGWRLANVATASGTSCTAGTGPQPKRSSPASSLVICLISWAR